MSTLPSPAVKILIIEDHEILAASLKDILERAGEFLVVGIAPNGAAALEQLKKTPADIVLLDLVLPGTNGFEVARELLAHFPHAKIAVCTGVASDEAIEMAFANGAHSFVEKTAPIAELLTALRMLRNGDCYLTERQARVLKESVQRRSARKPLARHDLGILQRLALSMPAKVVAAEEGVSQSCVYKARRRIAERVGVFGPSGIQAAVKLGLVHDERFDPAGPKKEKITPHRGDSS